MKTFACSSCGATGLKVRGGYAICPYCDSKFLMDREERSAASGGKYTFESHGPSQIGLDSDIRRLLDKCRKEPRNARKYANLILDMDPDNQEALAYLK